MTIAFRAPLVPQSPEEIPRFLEELAARLEEAFNEADENIEANADAISSISFEGIGVGGVYINTTGANPATELGYGTWVKTARGRMIMGEGTSDVAYTTGGATGGASNHTLNIAELPAHDHGGGDHRHSFNYANATESGTNQSTVGSMSGNATKNTNFSGAIITSQGGGQDHNNMPPYEVFHVWERTA